jgi:prepilin-type N-terminal cleavage/methylation domain-containing protein
MTNNNGFTLIEIITVLLILGVIAVSLISVFSERSLEESVSADTLKTHLRYAQSRAMNSDVNWEIRFDGTTYTLLRDTGGTPQAEQLPGESRLKVSLPVAVTGRVAFDTWGRPSGLTTIVLGDRTLTITPDTGFIP